jgi:antitoxin component YwqK of YwqJK toxin-antitoxin module
VFRKMVLSFVGNETRKVTSVYAEIKEDLEVKDDCLLLKNSPFSGVLVKHENSTKIERNYLNGKLHGLQKSYFLNGQLSTITLYTDNVQNGRRIEYYECGSKKLNANYTDGELDGISEEWCTGGVLIMRKTFYKGKLIAIRSN